MVGTSDKPSTRELQESLSAWIATTEVLLELVPGATPQELLDYAKGVVESPVAAQVLAVAMAPTTPAEKVPPNGRIRR